MLLAIDIGNSNISVGLFDKAGKLLFLSSIDTDSRKTADQISIDLMNLFALYRYDLKDVTGAIFSSVVPPINFMMTKALTRLLGEPPMVVGPGVKTGLNIRMEVHNQLGADLVANAVAALEKYAPPIIMIDMGTATTISYISAKRSYEGGHLPKKQGIDSQVILIQHVAFDRTMPVILHADICDQKAGQLSVFEKRCCHKRTYIIYSEITDRILMFQKTVADL